MYEQDLVEWLIYHKIKPNQTKPNLTEPIIKLLDSLRHMQGFCAKYHMPLVCL